MIKWRSGQLAAFTRQIDKPFSPTIMAPRVADFKGIGLGATTLAFFGMFHAAEFVSPGVATVIANTQPLMAALMAHWLLGERLSIRGKAGLVLGFLEIVLISAPQLSSGGGDAFRIGIAYIVVAAIGITLSNVLIKKNANRIDPLMAMGWQLVIGGIPLPAPFEVCDRVATRVNSQSLVRYRTNDYSVPVAFGHREVWVRGYVHKVVIGCDSEIIARHPRSYDREDLIFNPVHYLPLQEKKIGALDQAAPLLGWDLPEEFTTLRRILEARVGKPGKREYVQVLRLVEAFDMEVLHGAVKDALRMGAIGYDAIKHLVLCRIEQRPPRLDLDIYPFLPRARVSTTSPANYMNLLAGGAS